MVKKTTHINILKEKTTPYIYCGRGRGEKNDPFKCHVGEYGWLGNPVVIGQECRFCHQIHSDGGSTLPCYEKYLQDRLMNDQKFSIRFYETLQGKTLGCFCAPKPCHCQIMIKFLDAPKKS